MEFEPKALLFRDVRLNQAYTISLCITNTYPTAVDFSLLPSSTRYTVSPNRVNLSHGQSIVITVRLFLNHLPSFSTENDSHEDSITIKSSYFEHQVGMTFFLHNRDVTTHASRSISPSLRSRTGPSGQSRSTSPGQRALQQSIETESSYQGSSRMRELEKQLAAKTRTVQNLESTITQLESKSPIVQEIVRSLIEQERLNFEEKSEKVSEIDYNVVQTSLFAVN
jgi:uncharacterized coiled-coil protein SlyX